MTPSKYKGPARDKPRKSNYQYWRASGGNFNGDDFYVMFSI